MALARGSSSTWILRVGGQRAHGDGELAGPAGQGAVPHFEYSKNHIEPARVDFASVVIRKDGIFISVSVGGL